MGLQVILRPLAEEDLQNIVAYIKQDNPVAAEKVGLQLLDLVDDLSSKPYMGKVVRSRGGIRRR